MSHLGLLLLVSSLGGCASATVVDLARNRYFYVSPEFQAARRTAQAVYVTRLLDRRTIPETEAGTTYKEIFSDNIWDRPVPAMIEDVLREEIDRSGIYNGMVTGTAGIPDPGEIVVEPTLLTMYRMREAFAEPGLVGLRRSVAHTSIHIRVRGPADAKGIRPVLMDETIESEVATEPSLARPVLGVVLSGQALHNVMAQTMMKLYESNIVSSGGGSSDRR